MPFCFKLSRDQMYLNTIFLILDSCVVLESYMYFGDWFFFNYSIIQEVELGGRTDVDEGSVDMEPVITPVGSVNNVRPLRERMSTYYTPTGSLILSDDYEEVPMLFQNVIYEEIDEVRVDATYVDEAPVTSLQMVYRRPS